ncbi:MULTISPECIES: VOC family protein [unclassified Streptomyces]|uniref:VOC family protein n=1 Tax=unclassified Streptomyces TaxID=2593676 RepID=UPI00116120B7|nr:hypothetical protein [Streptomyces sp. TSRI0281]
MFAAALFYGEVLGRAAENDTDVVYRRDHVLLDLGKRTVLSLRGDGRAVAAGGIRPGPADIHWRPEGFSRTLRDPDGGMFSLTHRKPRSG